MKHSFITLLSLLILVIGGTAFGQTTSAPIVRLNTPDNVAVVNGEAISRSSLAAESLQLHGVEVLQELIGNTLIRLECARLGISVTPDEVNDEILRRAQMFRISSEEWLRLLEERRGVSPEQLRYEIGWQLLLGKLAGERIIVTAEEMQIEYERNFGPAVRARQIVLASRAEAETVRAGVIQHPETFPSVAINRSICTITQPFAGMLPVMRRHTFNPGIENMLFAMQPGEVSQVVEFPQGHFTVFRVEERLQPENVDIAAVNEQLFRRIYDTRLPEIANEIMLELQSRAEIHIIFGTPLQHQFPGVAAVLNGRQFPNGQQVISQQELAEACIRKYGNGVLSDMINRRIVEQAARRQNIFISEQDIDNEIREMAFKHLPHLPDGSANTALWIERALEQTGLSLDMYRKNVVVPMLSLKRLTRPLVQVTDEDIQRAYEANFGKQVQCLIIVFDTRDQRRATEIWQRANGNRTETAFADLAERYSFDPVSRHGRGVIPPIARHTGHPELESHAFALRPGEISPIFQVEDKLVILYCVSHINPQQIPLEDVKDELIENIFERKQQHIISLFFERLFEQATFINHLTGEMQEPALERAMQGGGNMQ